MLVCLGFVMLSKSGHAVCYGCSASDCAAAVPIIEEAHETHQDVIMEWMAEAWVQPRELFLEEYFKTLFLPALMRFTEQMSAVAMQQAQIIGSFFDAKHQLETERLFQTLEYEAHRDYMPTEDFCVFGTSSRSLAASEHRGKLNAVAMHKRQLDRGLGSVGISGALDRDQDKMARWKKFMNTTCDTNDNDGTLSLACRSGEHRVNRDIDYTRLIEDNSTLGVALMDNRATRDEADVLEMSNYLYGHDTLTRRADREQLQTKDLQHLYMKLRTVAAKRSIAANAFNNIVGMKSYGSSDSEENKEDSKTREFLGAILVELGVENDDEDEDGDISDEIYGDDGKHNGLIGKHPSYYAQLELLAKKIYQNPDFFTDLYDTPTGVERKKVALKAIELMLDRALYESELRQEMITSVLLSSSYRERVQSLDKEMSAEAEGG